MTREDRGASSFDELASGLASGTLSRGRALRLMGAALVGGTLTSLGIGEAAADPPGCKRAGKRCKNDTQCCSGLLCDTNGTCATCRSDGGSCTSNSQCCGGFCTEGVCEGPNLVSCLCQDGSPLHECSSIDCASITQQNEVCMRLCAQLGGPTEGFTSCDPNVCTPF
jgi:hypothetical protein